MSKFKVGDRVVFTAQGHDIGYKNPPIGSFATITRFDGTYWWMDCEFDSGNHCYGFADFELATYPCDNELQELRAFKAEALAAGYVPKAAVDGDLLEARAITLAAFAKTFISNGNMRSNEMYCRIEDGKGDDNTWVQSHLAAIRRGRELAAQEAGK